MAKRTTYTNLNLKKTSYSDDLYKQDLLSNNEFNIDVNKYKEEAQTQFTKRNKRSAKIAKSALFSLTFLLFIFSFIVNGNIDAPLFESVLADADVVGVIKEKPISEHEQRISNRVRLLLDIPTKEFQQTVPEPNNVSNSQSVTNTSASSLTLTATSVIVNGTIPQPPTATVDLSIPTATWTPDINNPLPTATDTPIIIETFAKIEETPTPIPDIEVVEIPTNTPGPEPTNTVEIINTNTTIPTQTPVPLIQVTPTPFETIVYINPTPIGTFVGTDGTFDGLPGLVPAPKSSDSGKFLRSDGVWANIQFQASVTPVILPTAANTVTPIPQPTVVSTPTPIILPTNLPTSTPYTPMPTVTAINTPTPLPVELLVTATPIILPTLEPTVTPIAPELLVTATPIVIPATPVVIGNSISQNGVIINWGTIKINGGTGSFVTLSQPYNNTSYSISFAIDGTWGVNGNIEAPVWYSNVSPSRFKISADSQIGGSVEVRWQTIGK